MRQKRVIRRFVPPERLAACVAIAGCLAVIVFPTVSRGFSPSRPVWSQPVVVDRVAPTQDASPVELTCPFQQLCLAVDGLGNVLSTTDPAGGGPWDAGRVSTATNILTLPACSSPQLCLVGDHNGHVFISTAPAGPDAVWRRSGFSDSLPIQEIVCPSASLCVLADTGGHLFTTTDPSGGRESWRRLNLHIQSIEGISCPTTEFCAVATQYGEVLTSSDPAGGPSAWSKQQLINSPTNYLNGIACPSAQLCLTSDANNNVYSSTTPATGPWHKQPGIKTGGLGRIWCPSTSLCFIGYIYGGRLLASSDPTAGASAWHEITFPAPPENGQVQVACPSTSFCLAEDSDDTRGYLFSSTDPPNGPWQARPAIDGYNRLTRASCGSGVCAAVDAAGDVLTSTDPSGGADAWQGERIDAAHQLVGVSCASKALCAAVDRSGGIHTSQNPTAADATWGRTEIDHGASLTALDCPSSRLCMAVDGGGWVLTATRPTGGERVWHRVRVARHGLSAVACPSASRCLVAGEAGGILTSTDPIAGRWRRVSVRGVRGIVSASCPTARLCVLVAANRGLVVSRHPWARRAGWRREATGDAAFHMRQIACGSVRLCVGLYRLSHEGETYTAIYESTDPAAPAPRWSYAADTLGNPTGLACQPNTTVCMAVDNVGEVVASK